jgi:hypothetical protein
MGKTRKTLGQLRDDGDTWVCPGCSKENVYSLTYVQSVLSRRDLRTLAGSNNPDDLPVVTGSAFESHCGACRGYFAPVQLDDAAYR